MTFSPFFALAMLAPNRQRRFRAAASLHTAIVAVVIAAVLRQPAALPLAAQALMILGIVEGAMLIGWRLTQLPKSQALEFLLVSPIQPRRVYVAEAAVALSRAGLIALAGAPILGVLVLAGRIGLDDWLVLLLMPLTWAAISGFAVTVWAYESPASRRVLESIALVGVTVYLLVGVLAGENLPLWLAGLPESLRWWIMQWYGWLHTANPFSVLQYWFEPTRNPIVAAERMLGLQIAAVGALGLLLFRGSARLRGHFHDRHYRPITDRPARSHVGPGERPLSWWAVRRVMEYSGRINIWLAGGFGLLYAAYTVAGDSWPAWMGRLIFQMVHSMGGIAVLATGLVLLAAVPACFQYGLWDSSVSNRCRRLELLLLTRLEGIDYWRAAAAAAGRRGRAYFGVAVLLWLAAFVSGQAPLNHVMMAAASGVLLWSLYFALGFWSFARGRQASGLGMTLTIGLPLLGVLAVRFLGASAAAWLPPGNVWLALRMGPAPIVVCGSVVIGIAALVIGRSAHSACDRDLRVWYERHHGHAQAD